MSLIEKVEGWLFSVALKKAVSRVVAFVIAFLTSAKLVPLLEAWGVRIDVVTFQTALTAFLVGGIEIARNYIKVKYGVKLA